MEEMQKGKYLKLQAKKRAQENFYWGTIRLAFMFILGLVGVFYFMLWISPLVGGQIEVWPTEVSIDQIEAEGFPDAEYLKVSDGWIIFSEANLEVGNKGKEISRLTAPVISQSQREAWEESANRREPIDASRFHLFVDFNGEQVARLWPDAEDLRDKKEGLQKSPVKMTVTGDTGPAKHSFYKPMQAGLPKKGLDWEKVRFLKFERHFHSLGNNIKNFIYAIVLLALSVFVFKRHFKKRRRPIPRGTPDPLAAVVDEASDDDSDDPDIDVD
jgi:hypothetical protein